MTTVAYKDGVLACDKQASANGTRFKAASKMVVTDDHAYVVVGDLAHGLHFIASLSDDEPAELKKAAVLCMDRKTGKAVVYESPGYPIPIEDRIFACGSGGDIALGAMAAGATPEEAVKIAGAWDEGTGFGVQVVESDGAKRRRRN